MMEYQTKNFAFETKQLLEDGTFEGYASIFGNKDSYNDIVHKGTFVDSLLKRKPKLLWQHNRENVIGIYTEVKEDEKGLYVKGKLTLGVEKAKEAYALLKDGALDGLSIGYSLERGGYEIDAENEIRNIRKAELYEISLVTFPANEKSLVNNVKEQGKSIEQFDCMKDFENFLKEPRSLNSHERKTFISKLKEFSKKRDAEEEEAKKRDAIAKQEAANKAILSYLDNLLTNKNI